MKLPSFLDKRVVPEQFRLGVGAEASNAQKAWLSGFDYAFNLAQEFLKALDEQKPGESQSIKSDRISESTIARMAGNIVAGMNTWMDKSNHPAIAQKAVAMARAIAEEVRKTGAESCGEFYPESADFKCELPKGHNGPHTIKLYGGPAQW